VKRKRKLEITVETNERFIFKRSRSSVPINCKECGGQLITTEVAVTLTGISARGVHRRAEGGQIHFMETAEGLLLVCFNSLSSI
jgi:hypothetical protein